ncbi:hypothetical protein SALBM135S_00682 [Streptomyces alboniger]
MTRSTVWKVWYEDWQMECCGTPFAVGDEVAWPLMITEEWGDAAWAADLSELAAPVEALADIEGDWSDDAFDDDDEDDDEDEPGDTDVQGEDVWDDGYDGTFEEFMGEDGDDGDDSDDDEDFKEPFEPSVVRDRGVTVPWNRPAPWPEQGRPAGLLTVERHGGRWPRTAGRVLAIHVVTQEFAETHAGSAAFEAVPGERTLRPVEQCPRWFRREAAARAGDGREHYWGETGVLVELEVPQM